MYILGALTIKFAHTYTYYAFASFFSFYKSKNFLSRKEKFAKYQKINIFFLQKKTFNGERHITLNT